MGLSKKWATAGWGRATASPQLRETGGSPETPPQPPIVQLLGDVDQPDFRDAIGLIRDDSRLISNAGTQPELIVVAQSRPDVTGSEELKQLRGASPLAGIVALLGSWCEGETRTGRPWPGVQRLYWYEFPAWWRRQLQLRVANRCPDWARPATQLVR